MGIYSELAMGEIAGFEAGLTSDHDLWLHAQSFQQANFEREYLIGVGAGFVEGKAIRKRLRESNNAIHFEKNIDLYLFFTQCRRSHKAFQNISPERVLQHQSLWLYYSIPQKVCEESLQLLKQQRLQSAIEIIQGYYLNHFCLEAWRSFEQIAQLLVQIRVGKKKGTVDAITRAQQRADLEQQLHNWIASHIA